MIVVLKMEIGIEMFNSGLFLGLLLPYINVEWEKLSIFFNFLIPGVHPFQWAL
jgi:hypothetical protein